MQHVLTCVIRLLALGAYIAPVCCDAASGPLGIDHRLPYDDSGIWARNDQLILEKAVIVTELGGALWLGGEGRLGRTDWQSVDSSVFSAATVEVMKRLFGREDLPRPLIRTSGSKAGKASQAVKWRCRRVL